MPVLNMEVPINTEAYYRGETIARREGVSLYDKFAQWLNKHIDGCEDPRVTGKGLTANRSGQWRYRIGDYRVLCLLRDEVVTVEVFRIRHRSEAYK